MTPPPTPRFTLPDFLRVSWVSDPAQRTWEARFERIRSAWPLVAVAHARATGGITLRSLAPWRIFGLTAAITEEDLGTEVLGVRGRSLPLTPMLAPAQVRIRPFVYDVAIGPKSALAPLTALWEARDYPAVLAEAGTPACCVDALRRQLQQPSVDPLWLLNTTSEPLDATTTSRTIGGSGLSYPFWRWFQLEPVYHLPCSFSCQSTARRVQSMQKLARDCGFHEEMDWLEEIFSWPVEWSALHGIAEVRTPVVKLCCSTPSTHDLRTLRYEGPNYPAEGAQGLRFPYRPPAQRRTTAQPLRQLSPAGDSPTRRT